MITSGDIAYSKNKTANSRSSAIKYRRARTSIFFYPNKTND